MTSTQKLCTNILHRCYNILKTFTHLNACQQKKLLNARSNIKTKEALLKDDLDVVTEYFR